jgi:DNA-binding NarL/FixJ family response regulator
MAEGLKGLLEDEFELAGTAENGRELMDKAKQLHPDVIVTDITMPLLNGIDAVRQLREEGVEAKVIFLTMHHDVMYATRAFDAGASGFVLKHSASSELITAINEAMKGRTYVTPLIADEVMESYRTGDYKKDASARLTTRQREVLQLLAEGKSAKEIARVLCISSRTAEFHKYKIMETLSIENSAELIQFAIKSGIVAI